MIYALPGEGFMYSVRLRFYEELNDFLPPDRRKLEFGFSFNGKRSVKDLVESLGVPHVEIDLILVNGNSVDFNYTVRNNDRISVYPVFETLLISNITRLRPHPLRDPRFVLDVHLGKLAKWLRLLGFDTDYEKSRGDDVLADISEKESRILLTRDRQLLKRSMVTRGLLVRNTDPMKQLAEITERLDLYNLCRPFTRCVKCNGLVVPVEYQGDEFLRIHDMIPKGVLSWCREYSVCEKCGRIYWKGSHYDRMLAKIETLKEKR